jgi:Peroxiredoxin
MVEFEKTCAKLHIERQPKEACCLSAQLNQKSSMIALGSKAPEFSLPDQHGKTVSLSDFKGKKVLLVFYPGRQHAGFARRNSVRIAITFPPFEQAGVQVLGH